MQITLRQLQVFLKVAQHLSYTAAAEKLFMSQPAVSKQVQQLEAQVGLALFERMGKRIYLSAAGERLQDYAQRILQQVAEAKTEMVALRGGFQGCLKVAVATTASAFAIEMLGQFRQSYPQVDFEFEVANRQSLLKSLETNLVDLVIMGLPPEPSPFSAEPFMQNPLVFIAPPNHRLLGKPLSLADLAKERFVAREEGSGTRQAMEKFFQAQGQTVKIGTLFNSNDAIKSAVISGLGLALVSIHTIRDELEHQRLALLQVEHAPIQRYWYLVHHKDKRLSAVAETFRAFVLEKTAV
ncbi:MAG: LysR family transcriptional regulator [Thiotrichales bacterium]|nr:LysR family transcriptional regulator [Thiotrichales bacterium]